MINMKNIGLSYGPKEIFKNLNCSVDAGDFVVIIGPNGVGKTTIFDLISGTVLPHDGQILCHGKDVTAIDYTGRSDLVFRIFQNPSHNIVGEMTVRENLALAMLRCNAVSLSHWTSVLDGVDERALFAPMGENTDILLQTPMNRLSGGQRQTIAFLLSTLFQPQILLLDEPTAALDPESATRLLMLVKEKHQVLKQTILFITHDLDIARYLGNKLWVIKDGKIAKTFEGDLKRTADLTPYLRSIEYEKLL
jgi:putative ABC transport system ATP-binding protein